MPPQFIYRNAEWKARSVSREQERTEKERQNTLVVPKTELQESMEKAAEVAVILDHTEDAREYTEEAMELVLQIVRRVTEQDSFEEGEQQSLETTEQERKHTEESKLQVLKAVKKVLQAREQKNRNLMEDDDADCPEARLSTVEAAQQALEDRERALAEKQEQQTQEEPQLRKSKRKEHVQQTLARIRESETEEKVLEIRAQMMKELADKKIADGTLEARQKVLETRQKTLEVRLKTLEAVQQTVDLRKETKTPNVLSANFTDISFTSGIGKFYASNGKEKENIVKMNGYFSCSMTLPEVSTIFLNGYELRASGTPLTVEGQDKLLSISFKLKGNEIFEYDTEDEVLKLKIRTTTSDQVKMATLKPPQNMKQATVEGVTVDNKTVTVRVKT